MSFYKNTSMIAVIVLIVLLAVIATLIQLNKDKVAYPPVTSECPDYWVDAGYLNSPEGEIYLKDQMIRDAVKNAIDQGNPNTCINFKKVGKATENAEQLTKNPSEFEGGDGIYNGSKICAQFQWAKSIDLSWDGITNRENVCSLPNSNN